MLPLGRIDLRTRAMALGVVAVIVLACFAIPLLYLFTHGGGFAIALGWIVSSSPGHRAMPGENLARLWGQLIGFGSFAWSILLVVGLLAILRVRNGALLLLASLLPILVIILVGTEVMPRHFVVGLPLALTLAGIGLFSLIRLIPSRPGQQIGIAAVAIVL